jgi:hypothetical protein
MLENLYIAICTYEGCDDCNPGNHIIGVFDTEIKAKEAIKEHDSTVTHYHFHYADIVKTELNELITSFY